MAEKLKGLLAEAGDMGGLDGVGRKLTGRLNLGDDLLKSAAGGKPVSSSPFDVSAPCTKHSLSFHSFFQEELFQDLVGLGPNHRLVIEHKGWN